jgi:hypothetical protein
MSDETRWNRDAYGAAECKAHGMIECPTCLTADLRARLAAAEVDARQALAHLRGTCGIEDDPASTRVEPVAREVARMYHAINASAAQTRAQLAAATERADMEAVKVAKLMIAARERDAAETKARQKAEERAAQLGLMYNTTCAERDRAAGERDAARAEAQRLREALEDIDRIGQGFVLGGTPVLAKMQARLRAALTPTPDPRPPCDCGVESSDCMAHKAGCARVRVDKEDRP